MKKNCIICGNEFTYFPYQKKLKKGKCCSKKCARISISKIIKYK